LSKTPKIVIIHGTGGHPARNWYPWLQDKVQSLGYEAIVPAFPTPAGQSLESWKKVFAQEVGPLSGNLILVGHSIGVGFILNLLEDSSVPVAESYLVAGFVGKLGLPEYDVLNQSFVCREFNWPVIRKNLGRACLMHSDNDPYVPWSKAEELAKKLEIEITLLPGAGHINYESGHTEFPLILEKLKSALSVEV
jgi:predicted alpha/beta hydrolase family esterase